MKYKVLFPTHSIAAKFTKTLSKIPQIKIQDEIKKRVEDLAANSHPFGKSPFKKLKPPVHFHEMTAQYRIRIGDYRVLYDVDDKKKTVWILALRKRSEKTYK
ncbi:MAG: type II toxin-antitoxin system RelE/ParE family toxin [Candidatus Scalindua sp.]